MTDYEDSKYFCDITTLKSTAEKYGVAIIPNVLTDEECQTMVDGIWGHFEHITQNWETPIKKMIKKAGVAYIDYSQCIVCYFNIGTWGIAKLCGISGKKKKLLIFFRNFGNVNPKIYWFRLTG